MLRFKNAVLDTLAITRRNLIRNIKSPQIIVFSTIQPIMFLLLFNYVFGGAIKLTSGSSYINYLLPGMVIQIVLFASTQAVIAMNADMGSGIIDRFKTLPISRSAVVFGRVLADMTRGFFVLCVLATLGFILGFRPTQGILRSFLALGLVMLFSFVFAWVSITLGLLAKDPESAQALGFVWVFPLVFASSIFVPTATMPHWLQVFALHQPITLVANSVRGLTVTGNISDLIPALLWLAGLFIVFFSLSIRLYSRKVS